jgi:hypothetical protein
VRTCPADKGRLGLMEGHEPRGLIDSDLLVCMGWRRWLATRSWAARQRQTGDESPCTLSLLWRAADAQHLTGKLLRCVGVACLATETPCILGV